MVCRVREGSRTAGSESPVELMEKDKLICTDRLLFLSSLQLDSPKSSPMGEPVLRYGM